MTSNTSETAIYLADLMAETFIEHKLPGYMQQGAMRIKDRFLESFKDKIDRRKADTWLQNLVNLTTDNLHEVIRNFPIDANELSSVKLGFEQTLLAPRNVNTPWILDKNQSKARRYRTASLRKWW